MGVAPELLAILVCPRCRGGLQVTPDGRLGCPRCAVAYPVADDIPVMIFEEASPWSPGAATGVEPA